MKRKFIMLCLAGSLALSLSGCGIVTNSPSFEDTTNSQLEMLTNRTNQLKLKMDQLDTDVQALKQATDTNTVTLKEKDLFFSSIRVVTDSAKDIDGKGKYAVVYNPPVDPKTKQTIDLLVDVSNSTEQELNQYVCQAVVTYTSSQGVLLNSYITDTTFNIKGKDFRKDIHLEKIPVASGNIKQVLILTIKDPAGNVIFSATKQIPVVNPS